MGLFICAKCECVENTALGHYWSKDRPDDYKWNKSNIKFKGKSLCSEHGPKEFKDGNKTGFGKWHKKFTQHSFREMKDSEQKGMINYKDFKDIDIDI